MKKTVLMTLMIVALTAPAFANVTGMDAKAYHEERMRIKQAHPQPPLGEVKKIEQPQVANQRNIQLLQQKLNANKALKPAERTELLNFYEKQSLENMYNGEADQSLDAALFDRVANTPKVTLDQRKAMITAFFDARKPKVVEPAPVVLPETAAPVVQPEAVAPVVQPEAVAPAVEPESAAPVADNPVEPKPQEAQPEQQ